MVDPKPPPSERRIGERRLSCFPAYIERPGHDPDAALIHDLSESGAGLLVRGPMKVGDAVRLQLYIAADSEASHAVRGAVVRVEPLAEDRASLWTHSVAVRFEAGIPEHEVEINAHNARLARLNLGKS